jgi:hypothetical protein
MLKLPAMCRTIKTVVCAGLLVPFLFASPESYANSVMVSWDPNSETDLAGYNVYHGEIGSGVTNKTEAGNQTFAGVAGLEEGKSYFFFVTAFNLAGLESEPSEVVTHSVATAATGLVVSSPSTVTSGESFSVTVTAWNDAGHVATDYRGTVEFGSTDAQAILPAAYTFQNSDNGSRVFTVTFNSTGDHALSITDGFITGSSGMIEVQAAPTHLLVSAPVTATAGRSFNLSVTARDGSGNLVNNYRGTVSFSSTDPQAVLPAPYKFKPSDKGYRIFSVTLRSAGEQIVRVTDEISVGTSGPIEVSPGEAAHLAVSSSTSSTAGEAIELTVSAMDEFGNLNKTYTGTVQFAASDLLAEIPANYTFQSSDNGSQSFSVIMKTAGEQNLTVTDGSVIGISETMVIDPAAAEYLDLSAPESAMAGETFSLTVTAHDPYGNVDTSYSGIVSFASTDNLAILPEAYTFQPTDDGSHIFEVVMATEGAQQMNATDSFISGTAGIMVMDLATAVEMNISAPSSALQGEEIDVTVTLRDALGNVAAGYQGTITFSSSDTEAFLPSNYTFQASDNGIKVFTVTFMTADKQTISAVDTVDGLLAGTSREINVRTAPGSRGPSQKNILAVPEMDGLSKGAVQIRRLQLLGSHVEADLFLVIWSGEGGQFYRVSTSKDLIKWVEVPAFISEIIPGFYQAHVVVEHSDAVFFRVKK